MILPYWKKIFKSFHPDTAISWHRRPFKKLWYKKCNKGGRPSVKNNIISIIKEIKKDNPFLSEEKINELLVSLNIEDAPCANTISKYLPNDKKPPTKKQQQSWKTFLKNHKSGIWSMDYLVVPTIKFDLLYIFVIVSHVRRKIEHIAVTKNPDTNWLIQQLRNATPYNHIPKYLIHDNDSAFMSKEFQNFLANTNIKSKPTSCYSPWQNGISERLNGILRQELLNHIIPINEKHVQTLLEEYINKYYNVHRTHQGIDCQTPIPLKKQPKTKMQDTKLIKTPVLNGLYHTYKKVA